MTADSQDLSALGLSFQHRARYLIDFFADRGAAGYTSRIGLYEVAARLARVARDGSVDAETVSRCVADLRPVLDDPHGDMFWMLPMALVQVLGEGVLPPEILSEMREQWRTYTPYRGDTENHWLMYHAALRIMAERFSDDAGDRWFNGNSSSENAAETTEYLTHWFDTVARWGLSEFDSPHYLPMYLAPLALLYGFSNDLSIRELAGKALDILIADFAADSLNGLYTGAFSRIYPVPLLERGRNPSTTFAWLLFGNIEFRPDAVNIILPRTGYRPHAAAVALACSGYVPADELHRAATDRREPYIHRELKRSRVHIRYTQERVTPVYKYAYVSADFAMGSAATRPAHPGEEMRKGSGLVQPIQQHTWELLWATADPHDTGNMLFALNPYSGPYEMGTWFPEEPRTMTKLVASQEKPTYDKADKWTGGSPFEQVFQHENCIVALYNIPAESRFPFVSMFLSSGLGAPDSVRGWSVFRVERVYVAVFALAPFTATAVEGGHRRLHANSLKNGVVVQCESATRFESYEEFCAGLSEPQFELVPVPTVRLRTLSGANVEARYGEDPLVDGAPVAYENWPLFDGPFIQSQAGSGIIDFVGYDGSARTIRIA